MHLPQQQRISLTLVTGLAALVAALALAAIAATPGYAKPDPQDPSTTIKASVLDGSTPVDARSPDRQAPAPEPPVFTGSASTTDTLGPEDGAPSTKPVVTKPVAQTGPPTWPEHPTSLPAPVSVSSDSDGLEFSSAAAGAGAVLMVGLLGLIGYAAVIRRRPVPAAH
jgi:MYXO-CTERM domain-containing protein